MKVGYVVMQENLLQNNLESINDTTCHLPGHGYRAARLALQASKQAILTREQRRVPRYHDGERENNAEHSHMLAVTAPEVALALNLDLDKSRIVELATAHELAENITGDLPTFLITEAEQSAKEQNEQAIYEELMASLPPYMRSVYAEYEAQASPEARFVRYVDKLLPVIVDILGDGKRVMEEDYGVSTIEALRAAHEHLHARITAMFGNEFPALDLAHRILCNMFEACFETDSVAA